MPNEYVLGMTLTKNRNLNMNMRILVIPFFINLAIVVNATNIKGFVKDKESGEPLIGAVIQVKNTSFNTMVKLDGSYVVKGVPSGTYTVGVSYVSNTSMEQVVTIADEKEKVLNFDLEKSTVTLNEVVVSKNYEKGSELQSRKLEQTSDNVMSVIGSLTIQLMPDVTVGNMMQRVSGVSIVRNGNGILQIKCSTIKTTHWFAGTTTIKCTRTGYSKIRSNNSFV